MAKLPRVAKRDRLTVFEQSGRLMIEHHGLPSGDGAYDWSCLQLSRTEAAWLASKLRQWALNDKSTQLGEQHNDSTEKP
jgi:hypothetical protein